MDSSKISISAFWDAQVFLKFVSKGNIKYSELKSSYLLTKKKFNLIELEGTLELCNKCNLINFENDFIVLTAEGEDIVGLIPDTGYSQFVARTQLLAYVRALRPFWAFSLTLGRKKSMAFVSERVSDIFTQLGLYDKNNIICDVEVVEWWDKLANTVYSNRQANNVKIGRLGERCSLIYEESRTEKMPQWVALEDNSLGYDILSQKSTQKLAKLCIEVKACSSDTRNFYISKNEWSVADSKTDDEFIFHIWDISKIDTPSLHIASKDVIMKHIPQNFGLGSWESCSIEIDGVVKNKNVVTRNASKLSTEILEIIRKSLKAES
jgi:hypothetical protein